MNIINYKKNAFARRTFRSALIELFEHEYKLIGSHNVIELIADDICQLRDEFYPRSKEKVYGSLGWVTTSSDNKKPKLGQREVMLPIKGNKLDMGSGITHKGIIIELYEKKIAPSDIARRVNHSQEAVDRYIKDYERVKFLARRGMNITEISHLTGRGKKVIKQYLEIFDRHKAADSHTGPCSKKGIATAC